MSKHIVKIALACVLVAAGGYALMGSFKTHEANAQGQEAQGEQKVAEAFDGQAWFKRCNAPDAPDAGAKVEGHCEIFQRQNVKDTGQRIMEFAIGYPEEAGNARGILILPLGIMLPPGIQLSIDDENSFKASVRFCNNNGCYAQVDLTDEIIDLMKKGTTASVTMIQPNGKPVKMTIPLKGFTKAIKEIG